MEEEANQDDFNSWVYREIAWFMIYSDNQSERLLPLLRRSLRVSWRMVEGRYDFHTLRGASC